ncbi:MAG: hypothetical protein AAF292_01405 [Pseudomonadota bacterium]
MFIGHYAAAYAVKAVRPAVPLWVLFVAVQFIDYVWAVLVIFGVEKIRYETGFTAANALDLIYIPYSHSLVGALIWSIAFGLLYLAFKRGAGVRTSALILATAAFSHWLADLIVHVPDLPLIWNEPKVGLGLWRHFWASQIVEVGLLLAGLIWYLRVTAPAAISGRFAPWLLFAFLVGLQAYNLIPAPEPPTTTFIGAQALAAFSVLAFLAWLTERTRVSV